MNTSEMFHLQYNDFQANIITLFQDIRKDNEYSDVTLACAGNEFIEAHKVILAASSTIFRDLLRQSNHSHPLLYMRGMQMNQLRAIVDFIYYGEVNVYQEDISDFMEVAKELELKGLSWSFSSEGSVESKHSEDFLATGSNLEVGGLMEHDYLKDIEEPVVENETLGLDSNYTVLDKICEINSLKNENKVILPSNQQEDGMFVCRECNSGFGTNLSLLHHKGSKHAGLRYLCDQCDNYFTQSSLNRHKQAMHEGVRYDCNQCDYSASYNGNLTKHIQVKHEGVRYYCTECDYRATQKSDLNKHTMSKHDDVKYDCSQCDNSFIQQNSLIKHKKMKHEDISDCN